MPGSKERREIRFHADPQTIARLDLKMTGKEFKPTLTALVLNESFSGCAILLADDFELKKGFKLRIKIGDLHPMKAEVAWTKVLEENIQKIGIKVLE